MTVNIVIGSFLEADLVERIASFDPEIRVFSRPDLLPVPRYACDHSAPPRQLSDEQLDEWRAIASQADVFFDFDWLSPSTMLERSPHLKWVQGTSAGIGGFVQRNGLDQGSLVLTTAGGIHAVPLAEFALMGVLHFVKGIPQLTTWQREHHWERYTTRQLQGMRALVVGLGGVGSQVVRQFSRQGVDVWGLGRTGRSYEIDGLARVVDRSHLDEVLPQIDILVLTCPLTKETEGMIGASQVELLKSDAIVVNISRGQVIDQGALLSALSNHRLGGACLDVFEEEPLPITNPLWGLDNVIVSPHSASTVRSENESLVDLFLDNFGRWRRGETMRNVYNAEAGY